MMMLQLTNADNGIEIPEEYRRSFLFYNQQATWLENIVRLEHYSGGYAGPAQGYLQLIGRENKLGQNTSAAFSANSTTLDFLDRTKCYRLVLDVVKVNNNTATDSTTDKLTVAIGTRENQYSQTLNIKDIVAGTKIEIEMTATTGFSCAVFGSTVGSALWSFDFDVKLEEV
jgi:hypothetical protein